MITLVSWDINTSSVLVEATAVVEIASDDDAPTFDVLRSDDGKKTWTLIGSATPVSLGDNRYQYDFSDSTVSAGVAYAYKLVDEDENEYGPRMVRVPRK